MKILNLIKKDFQLFFKSPSAVVLTYLVPMVLSLVFGLVFGGMGGSSDMNEILILMVDADNTEFSKEFRTSLDNLPELIVQSEFSKNDKVYTFTKETMDEWIEKGKRGVGIYIPQGFYEKMKEGEKIPLEIHYDPKYNIQYGIVNGLIQKTIMSKFPQVFFNSMWAKSEAYLGESENKKFKDDMTKTISKFFPEAKTESAKPKSGNIQEMPEGFMDNPLDVKNVKLLGKKEKSPMYAQYVAGMAVMFLLFSVTYAGASILEEKNDGTIKRLLVSPISKGQILSAKMIYTSLVGISQLIILFVFGWLVFGLNIFQAIPAMIVMIISTSLACSALGILIAAICNNLRAVNSLSTLLILTMSLLGGSMVPSIVMPKYIQSIGKFTLNHWAMQGFTNIFWRGMHLKDVLPEAGVLIAIFAVFYFTAVKLFNKRLVT